MEKELRVMRNGKDTVFTMLYRDRRNLLSLYNGLNGTDYDDPNDLEVTTLENAVYMTYKNDVSFILGQELNLYEHQASYNPNMPLRFLIYVAQHLEKFIVDKSIYSSRPVKIPTPRFVVFYNGTEKHPERDTLRLSAAYEKSMKEPELELTVQMLNINYGCNKELMEKCRTLQEYSIYVARIREFAANLPIEEAVDQAVTTCIRDDILKDFLAAQRAEVVAMSIFEYNEEEEMRKIREDEYQQGEETGIQKGIKTLVLANLSNGISEEQTINQLMQYFNLDSKKAKEYFEQNSKEVIAMSIFEYNEEVEMRKIREDEYQQGREEGERIGELRTIVEIYREFGMSEEEIVKKVMQKYNLSEAQARERIAEYFEQYSKEE